MRHLLHISLLLVLLSVAVIGCRPSTSDAERRLIALDSLIATAPDSALTQLAATDTATLSEPERAYLALLLTQAMYKAYVPATSDSLISRAWRYYEHSGPYDRCVRALLYQGTVAEELGRPEQAMRWYKQAENYARPDDHYNRGYILMRQANLLQRLYLTPEQAIQCFKEARQCFVKAGETYYELACVSSLGEIYRLTNLDSAQVYINSGIEMSLEKCDSVSYWRNMTSLAGYEFERKEWRAASSLSRNILQDRSQRFNFDCCFFGVVAYCRQSELDSAAMLLSMFDSIVPKSRRDSILLFHSQSQYERAKGHTNEFAFFDSLALSKTDSAYMESKIISVLNASKDTSSSSMQLGWQFIALIVIAVLALLFAMWLLSYQRSYSQSQRQLRELRIAYAQLKSEYESFQDEKRNSNDSIELSTDDRLLSAVCLETLINRLTFCGPSGVSIFKQIDHLNEMIPTKQKEFHVNKIELNDDFWHTLERLMLARYPNTMKQIHEGRLKINDNELKLMSLDCLHVPNTVISLIVDYSERSVASVKYRITKKLGASGQNLAEVLSKREREDF